MEKIFLVKIKMISHNMLTSNKLERRLGYEGVRFQLPQFVKIVFKSIFLASSDYWATFCLLLDFNMVHTPFIKHYAI